MKALLSILFLLSCISKKEIYNHGLGNASWEFCFFENSIKIDLQNCKFEPIQDKVQFEKEMNLKQGVLILKNNFEIKNFSLESPSIYLGAINPVDETYLNDTLIGKTGKIELNDSYFFSFWNDIRSYRVEKSILKEKNSLLIIIPYRYEFSFSWLLIIDECDILDDIKKREDFFRSYIYFPISILLFFIFSFYFLVHLLNRDDKIVLYYSILCLTSFISQTNFYITKLPIDLSLFGNYLNFQKIVFSSICIFPFTGILFANSLLRSKISIYENIFFTIITLGSGLAFLCIPNYQSLSEFRTPLFSICTFIPMFYGLFLFIYKTYQKNKNARLFLIGLIPFSICILFDLLLHNITKHDDLPYLSFLGMPSFIISIGVMQAYNFVKDRRELRLLNQSLDKKVEERTLELQKANELSRQALVELERISRIDPLTSLSNRMHLMNLLEDEFRYARFNDLEFTILLIDIDFFKRINDNYGHLVGDEALRFLGKIIRNSLPENSFAGRYGGEEFSILLPKRDSRVSFQIAEVLRENVQNSEFCSKQTIIPLTLSIGVSSLLSTDSTIQDIIERADKALYKAKLEGRNKTIIYS
jgi:diguanylate cyclase (GGDEF)-like protein